MSNFINDIFKNHGRSDQYYTDIPNSRHDVNGKGLIVMGYSAVFYDLHPNSRVNNPNNW